MRKGATGKRRPKQPAAKQKQKTTRYLEPNVKVVVKSQAPPTARYQAPEVKVAPKQQALPQLPTTLSSVSFLPNKPFSSSPLMVSFCTNKVFIARSMTGRDLVELLRNAFQYCRSSGAPVDEQGRIHIPLRYLSLRRNQIGDEGALELAKFLDWNVGLEALNLNECDIGDLGGTAISTALRHHPSLLHLDVSHNRILHLSDFFDRVITTRKFSIMKYLDIRNNQLLGLKGMVETVARHFTNAGENASLVTLKVASGDYYGSGLYCFYESNPHLLFASLQKTRNLTTLQLDLSFRTSGSLEMAYKLLLLNQSLVVYPTNAKRQQGKIMVHPFLDILHRNFRSLVKNVMFGADIPVPSVILDIIVMYMDKDRNSASYHFEDQYMAA